MRIVFQHLRDTDNIGDRSCSPFDRFDWGDAAVQDIRQPVPGSFDVGIFGGGKIFGGLSRYAGVERRPGQLNIAWGVSTVQSFPLSLRYARARRLMDLVGTRDWGDERYTWAPCASCMSPLFGWDRGPAEHETVFYAHAGKTRKMGMTVPDGMPVLTNTCDSLETALDFIASGETVVSNSYHGVLWGLLLGRKVLCVPFSRKFDGYRIPPGFATPADWLDKLGEARATDELLPISREATADFRLQVMDRIGDARRRRGRDA